MKKLFSFAVLTFLCVLMAIGIYASDTVVYLSSGGTGDGTSADSPIATLESAYAAIGNNDGTIVLMSDYAIATATDLPKHTGNITITSLYGGVDYRTSNTAAISYTTPARLACGGPTRFENLNINIKSTGAIIAANFNPLVIGDGITITDSGNVTVPRMYVVGGPNNDETVPVLGSGQTSSVEIYSGSYLQVCAFSRLVTTASHTGTMTVTVGNDVYIKELYLGANNTATAIGGTAVCNLSDNVSVGSLYLSSSNASSKMNGSVTLNVTGNTSIDAFVRYLAKFFPNGTRTLNYESTATLPDSLATYFDTVTLVDSSESEDPEVPANLDIVYVADGGTGDGTSASAPISTLTVAYELLNEDGGTIVIVDTLSMTANVAAPAHSGTVTFTSVYGGTDYRESGASIAFTSPIRLVLGGETVFKDITLDVTTTAVIAAAFNPITFDTGVTVNDSYATAEANGLYVVGGHNNVNHSSDTTTRTENTSITAKSGKFSRIVGFSRYCGARVHTGTATITLSGDAYVNYLFAGAVEGNTTIGYATAKNSIINLSDNAIIENLYTGGSNSKNLTTGEVIINVNGGDIYEFDVISLDTSADKVTLNYDPRTVADGIVELAEMAHFNVLSTCDIAKAHTYGESFANPFGGSLTAHTCEVCGYTELVEDAPEAVANGVVFVADGGFGDGLSPLHPFGDLEKAFNVLGTEGGTIVLVDECTLPQNMFYKIGSAPKSFQEPRHENEILITSLYNNVDYRENGAKLIFNGNMHYRLSGPTTFDNIVFDTAGEPATNLIAARYNPLTFGDNCQMLKTVDDGYQLWVVGGYQYFRYTDFIGVEIEDPLLEMVTPARPVDWDFAPDDLVEMTYTAGCGNEFTVTLQKDAAAAFEAMFADMAKEGLYVPYAGWNFRSARTQYSIFTNALGNLRAKGYDYDSGYLAVAKSCSIPGSSEHQLGFAFDIYDERLEETYGEGSAHSYYDQTEEWQWIVDNAANYGLILRFLKTKTAQTGFIYEAWHFRYVGVEHAKAIAATDGYCLEEYVGEVTGMFDMNSCVTINSGSFYQVMGGSRGCDNLTFTGTRHVTVGDNATVTNLIDIDAGVGEEAPDKLTLAGDANEDGVITLLDALRILRHISGISVEINTANADFDANKVIDVSDVLLTIKAMLE